MDDNFVSERLIEELMIECARSLGLSLDEIETRLEACDDVIAKAIEEFVQTRLMRETIRANVLEADNG